MNGGHHRTRLLDALNAVEVKDPALLRRRMTWYDPDREGMPQDPAFALGLDDAEIQILADWFAETNDIPYCGEVGFQSLSMISTLLSMSRMKNVVQLGHYAGFSSLVIGFILRRISPDARLISFDIDQSLTDYSQQWTKRAGLEAQVIHVCADSTDPLTVEMAGAYLAGNPQLVFIDASKQYRNTIFEVQQWAEYTNGFILAHDVSLVAMGGQANGERGVSQGLVDSGQFATHELLLLDPHEERRANFPYHDDMGLGLGISRGQSPLPKTGRTLDEVLKAKRILDSSRLDAAENWFLEGNFSFSDARLHKAAGDIGWAGAFAPVQAGQTLKFELELADSNGGEAAVCAGGQPGTFAAVTGDGLHHGEFVVGAENMRIAIYGPPESEFSITSLRFFVGD
jgi:predicted O-methyltransferase YrrM